MSNPERRIERWCPIVEGATSSLDTSLLGKLKRWRLPRIAQVGFDSDVTHDAIPCEAIRATIHAMMDAPQHMYHLLVHNPVRLVGIINSDARLRMGINQAPIWIGAPVEDEYDVWRINDLRALNSPRAWLSCEPLSGSLGSLTLDGIGWVVASGQSGNGARPMHPDWIRELRDQCVASRVPFRFTGWGEWVETSARDVAYSTEYLRHPLRPDDERARFVLSSGEAYGVADMAMRAMVWGERIIPMRRVGARNAGQVLDGEVWDQWPEGAR